MLLLSGALLLVGVAVVAPTPSPGAEHSPTPPTEQRPSSKVQDNHKYYTLSVYQNNQEGSFDKNFIDMENAEIKTGLSDTMVGAETISPPFNFPFYGHMVEDFYITTHGFLSLSPRLHDYIYKTQYIAPLRIKLDPSRSNSSTISVLPLQERLTVEWSNVSVMADAEHPNGGSFTFQVTLYPNGTIVFVYIEVQPVLTMAALYDHEPVAGISDAFLLHGSELHLYNKINIQNVDINTRTVAVFEPLPTCIAQKTCHECLDLRENSEFGCFWCESAGHCSDGADRLRERWNQNQCHNSTNSTTCDAGSATSSIHNSMYDPQPLLQSSPSTSTIVSITISSILIVILLIIFVAFVYLYGKYNEDTLVGRHLKRLKQSYEQFGGATAKMTSLELGKKKSKAEEKAKEKAKNKAVSEFINPHPMANNNNVITANM